MKTEYQKCMDGEFFTADSEMLQIVYRCKRLVRSLNEYITALTHQRYEHILAVPIYLPVLRRNIRT